MPTIDELPASVSVSDGDELMVSQSDVARKATRAQLLSGVQPAIALPAGSLLGRLTPGIGAPEVITIGANLTIASGTVSAPPPFVIEQLTSGGSPMATDEVPIGQGGQNAAISYAAFISGLSTISHVDGSNLTAIATGATGSRRIADCFGDALTVEAFGAIGDGVTDDTAAFIAALASGQPLRLAAKTYIINGALEFTQTAAMLGVEGATVIRRALITAPSAWIDVSSPSLSVLGITFDAAGLTGNDNPVVSIRPACLASTFIGCRFLNARGASFGSGVNIQGVSGSVCELDRSHFVANSLHGVMATGTGSLVINGCTSSSNGQSGFWVDAGVSCAVRDNLSTGNRIGLSIGNWAAGPGPRPGGPQCAVTGNSVSGNAVWGIAISGVGAVVDGNCASNNGVSLPGGGILARLGASQLVGNNVSLGGIGIDARGCWGSTISGNHISAAATGMTVGGSQNLTVGKNVFLTNGWGISISAIEPAISAVPTGPVTISDNWIGFTTAQGGGISLTDAVQNIAIVSNDFNGWGSATVDQAAWLHTDAAVLTGNRWNNQAEISIQANTVNGLEALVVPDIYERVLVSSAPAPIASLLTNHQADTLGQVTFIKVTNGGAGYTQAQISIAGSGIGAAAKAVVFDGQVVWIILSNSGSGYGIIGSQATVTINGDGVGASATAYVGLPVLTGRRLRLSCSARLQLALNGSSPSLQIWTEFQSTIPASGAVDLEGYNGGWRAVAFPPVDYLAPTGDGGVVFQSVAGGSISLRPASGGALHIASEAEVTGCTSSVGRGSPLGLITAPPGSDFRNLNGGVGNTFWIKQNNNDATGWIAIA